MDSNEVTISLEDSPSSGGSFASTTSGPCCGSGRDLVVDMEVDDKDKGDEQFHLRAPVDLQKSKGTNKYSSDLSGGNSYAANKNVAEGLMDIALLSANANQLRFLITYNDKASTYVYSMIMVILSLVLQLLVGIMLIFKRRLKRFKNRSYERTNDLLVMGVFMITVVNILLAAFTTTDGGTH
ncbi:ninjurin-1 [Drosophila subpulchrella]|uniref:ninjurin-1 n=1 Tax=Drosophila subpulchrella TaxID=1486046 RepID=UPI0018A13F1D|nr:ninjurin-1 [Drosophila subpulchrella]